jgi:hypothetical protein
VNDNEVDKACRDLGMSSSQGTDQGCSNGLEMIVNADLGTAVIAVVMVHEAQHVLGRGTYGPEDKVPGGEPCARKRATNFVQAMTDHTLKAQALSNKYVNDMWTRNWPGCKF